MMKEIATAAEPGGGGPASIEAYWTSRRALFGPLTHEARHPVDRAPAAKRPRGIEIYYQNSETLLLPQIVAPRTPAIRITPPGPRVRKSGLSGDSVVNVRLDDPVVILLGT
jgi:hypothetical protein